MPNKLNFLSYAECQALKGLAILGIVLHNFCHCLHHADIENEFGFSQERTYRFFDLLMSGGIRALLNALAFLGHYGVPIFIFCTGYGLVMKYEHSNPDVTTRRFILSHYFKLLRLLLPGFVITIVVIALLSHKSLTTWDNFILQSTLLINFHPDSATIIKPGPFWYFGFVMQLYLFYRLLIYRRHWGWIVASIVSCWFVQVIQQPDGPLLEWLRYNFVMGILPLSMGVLCGRQVKDMTFSALIWLLIAVVSFCAVIVCNLHFQPWLWTHVFVIISSVAFIKGLSPIAQRPFQWLGAISSCLFVMHPLARAYTLYPAQNGHVYRWLLAYIVLSMLLAWLYQRLMHYLTPIITKHEESI